MEFLPFRWWALSGNDLYRFEAIHGVGSMGCRLGSTAVVLYLDWN